MECQIVTRGGSVARVFHLILRRAQDDDLTGARRTLKKIASSSVRPIAFEFTSSDEPLNAIEVFRAG